jgi:Arc/MetJ-type ribon-helix-helix transcriptional regulator
MKLSISLPDEDVEFLDEYTADHGMSSRSAAVHEAVRLLRASGLGVAYEDAWADWAASGENELWEPTTGDGVGR